MNHSVPPIGLGSGQVSDQDDDTIELAFYLDLLFDNRWLIIGIAFVVAMLGAAYSVIATPIYEANISVQVEDSASSSKNVLGDLSSVFDLKTAATAEMEILRSRFVVTRAVDDRKLYISAEPKYFPLIGRWVARRRHELSLPGLFGRGGYAWGAEEITVATFDVPERLENAKFLITAMGSERFRLDVPDGSEIEGRVGEQIVKEIDHGTIRLTVEQLSARVGAQFVLVRRPILEAVERLQSSLVIAEKGKQSGIIGVSLEGTSAQQTADTLNEIGRQYIRQNVDRKSEEAQKSLAFLEKQLPIMKANLEKAEAEYNNLRNSRGTVDLDEEAKSILQQSVLSQGKLVELKQRRDELLTRFQDANPLVEAVDRQIATISAEIERQNAKIKRMPSIEQDVLRLTRDVKVNTDLYTALLNSAQQLRLVKASKVGNARLLDIAERPLKPVRPKQAIIVAASIMIGLFLGIVGAFVRKNLFGGLDEPHEIERMLGLTVSGAIPHSEKQEILYRQMQLQPGKMAVLASDDPQDLAIESLRSFRTSLQFSMLGAKNNIVMISGPTPGVGKSFVSVNLAAVYAATGKKVLLIDADLRKGYLQKYFGMKRQGGLSEIIAGELSIDAASHKSVLENLDFIATGELPPRPAELLTHPRFADFLSEASLIYDLVLLDTAPVLPVSDALVVAPSVGTVFNIVRGGVSTLGEIEEAVKRFNQVGSAVTGIVFNDLKPRIGRYGYGSKYAKYRYAQYKY
jgi:tyrosine-protein kinase Etk/Wzc